jgi:hypothetical protein
MIFVTKKENAFTAEVTESDSLTCRLSLVELGGALEHLKPHLKLGRCGRHQPLPIEQCGRIYLK